MFDPTLLLPPLLLLILILALISTLSIKGTKLFYLLFNLFVVIYALYLNYPDSSDMMKSLSFVIPMLIVTSIATYLRISVERKSVSQGLQPPFFRLFLTCFIGYFAAFVVAVVVAINFYS